MTSWKMRKKIMQIEITEIDEADAWYPKSASLVGTAGTFHEYGVWANNGYSYGEFEPNFPFRYADVTVDKLVFFGIKYKQIKGENLWQRLLAFLRLNSKNTKA